MILRTRSGSNVELRTGEWGTDHLIPRYGGWYSDSGLPITEADAYGLPAVSNVIRSPADIIGALPFFVYNSGDVRTEARNSWQWKLLHDQPSPDCDTFKFFYDLALSLEACQNAFLYKVRGVGSRSNRLEALEVIDPHRVRVERDRDSGEITFDVWVGPGKLVEGLTSREILHVRGFTPNPGGVVGVSLIQVHANSLGAMRAAQKFEGDYFKKGGLPPFWFTGASNATHAKEIKDAYNANRARASAGEPGALHGVIDVKSLPLSMVDAAYIENKNLSIEDACRIWRWPKELLELSSEPDAVNEGAWTSRFLKFYMLPRLKRIDRAFAADPDLFSGQPLFGEFKTAALEQADFVTRVRGYKDARQGGWVTANEIRQWENLPSVDGGDELQQTPVGGAPNPDSPSDSPDEEDE